MKFLFDFKSFRDIRKARKKRHAKTILPKETVFLRETNRQVEQVFFWRVLTMATLGLFFFSIVHRFAVSAPLHMETLEVVGNTPYDELVFMDDGFLRKPEVWTEAGDRSDVAGVVDYVVESADTISGIAKKFGVTQRTILQNNNFPDPKNLKEGAVLKIPAADGLVHKVKKGENIGAIAKKYKVDQKKLLAQNEMDEESVLRDGQEIIIPGINKSPPKKVIPSSGGAYGSAIGVPYGRETAGKLLFPTQGKYTQFFRYGHYAVDIAQSGGAPIWAADTGTVVRADYGWSGGYGNVVVIDHGNGMQTLYAHLSKVYVRVGDSVARGAPIGYMGNTGRVYGRTGIHLHFEVMVNGAKKNPRVYF